MISYFSLDSFGNPKQLDLLDIDHSITKTVQLDNDYPEKYDTNCWPVPKFSPNGRYLAIARTPTDNPEINQLALIDLESWKVIQILNNFGRSFSWSPDGQKIIYTTPTKYGEQGFSPDDGIWVFDLNSRQAQNLIPSSNIKPFGDVSWSSDGIHIGFHLAEYEGHGQFGITDIVSKKLRFFNRGVGGYDWSPDGKKIVFDVITYVVEGPSKIYTMDLDGSGVKPIISSEKFAASNPVWSPDGKRIMFTNGTTDDLNFQNWVVDPDGKNPQQIGAPNMSGMSLNWSSWLPDGKHIIGESEKKIYILAVDGPEIQLIIKGSCPDWRP